MVGVYLRCCDGQEERCASDSDIIESKQASVYHVTKDAYCSEELRKGASSWPGASLQSERVCQLLSS